VAAIAVAFLAFHLPFLAPSLADIDSVNLALGVRDFDPAQHRPHPPGYPIFIALGKFGAIFLSEPRALAIWGAVFGALAAFALWKFFRALEQADDAPGVSAAVAASAVTLASPLVWMTASRPLTDITGLGAAAVAQAILAAGMARQLGRVDDLSAREATVRAVQSGRLILAGAFAAALAIGVRSQIVWLTLPLLALVLFRRGGRGAMGALIGSVVWFGVGASLWAVPMMIATGGPSAYWAAFKAQTQGDWHDANILATHPGVRSLIASLVDTFLRPWESPVLGGVVLVLAAAGALWSLRYARKGLVALMAVALPYGAFHLLFQETPHTRYAVPLVPVVAYLAVRALAAVGRRTLALGTCAIVGWSLAIVHPKLVLYAKTDSPAARALADVRARLGAGGSATPLLALTSAVHIAWRDEPIRATRLPAFGLPSAVLARHWTSDRPAPVWLITDPEASGLDRVHDLVQIDPAARRLVASYRWPFDPVNLLGGVRPSDTDWYEIRPPGWIALDGWGLTPRLAGIAAANGTGPLHGGALALVRRQPGPVTALVGGRAIGKASAPPVQFTLKLDGVVQNTWASEQDGRGFVHVLAWPAGIPQGHGAFARLTIEADPSGMDAGSLTAVLTQFDVQPPGQPVLGFGEGWHEQEYDPAKGMLWRWTSERATLLVVGATGDVELRLTGDAPSRHFVRPSRVVVRVGPRVLLERGVANDIDLTVSIPLADLVESAGRVVIETDQTFIPAERAESPDRRPLGLRVYGVSLTPVSSPGTAENSRTEGRRP
jgi:hypothetical protein